MDVESLFSGMGAEFRLPYKELQKRLWGIRALLFDWDGIFNNGEKGSMPSTFSEIDSMGINMLRFGFFLLRDSIPFTAIVTGETNPTAFNWARREHLDYVFFQVKHKADMIGFLREHHGIAPEEVLFVYDDILDLSLADKAGLRFLVPHRASPMFLQYCRDKGLCDYICSRPGADHAVREISEVALGGLGLFEETVEKRAGSHPSYEKYYRLRNQKATSLLQSVNRGFEPRAFPEN